MKASLRVTFEGSKAIRHHVHKAASILVVTYGITVFLLWLLQLWLNEDVEGIGIIQSLLHLLLLPALILLPITMILRRWWLVLVLLPSFIAFFFSFGIYLVPRTQDTSASPVLRLMTFNIQVPDAQAAAALVTIIDEADADVVALQELTPAAAAAFEEELQQEYPYQAMHPQSDHSGQGVLSRYPIEADEFWRNTELPGGLGHQRVVFVVDQQQVVLYNVHPVPPVTFQQYLNAAPHREALTDLLARIDQNQGPGLLAGDFNMTDHFHGYDLITDTYTDAFRAVGEIGFGFTFPNTQQIPLPLLRLDYIFYSEEFEGLHAQVWPESGPADHAPVVADLTLIDAQNQATE